METIGPLQSGYLNPNPPKEKKVEKKKSVKTGFSSLLSSQPEEILVKGIPLRDDEDLSLEDLLDDIHQVGERLSQSPTMTAVLDYKQAVKQFIRYVVSRGLELVEQEGVKFANPMKKQKKYTIVRVLDQKLENLAAQIIQNQKDRLEILAAVDEIYGLLVDLLQ